MRVDLNDTAPSIAIVVNEKCVNSLLVAAVSKLEATN